MVSASSGQWSNRRSIPPRAIPPNVASPFRLLQDVLGRAMLLLLAVLVLNGCGKPTTSFALIRVTSTPVEEASVQIGGVSYGVTPCSLTGIREGDIYIILSKEGYIQTSKLIHVPETGTVDVNVVLSPVVGYATIDSDPRGARVLLDGTVFIGYTPLMAAPIPVGKHTYELRYENYEIYESEIEVEEDRRYTQRHVLKPMMAQLQIISRPSGARIWLDGEEQDEVTPARFSLPPATYSVTVYAKGFITGDKTVVLTPNSTEELEMRLKLGYVPEGMVLISAGEFTFGDEAAPHERPVRQMTLDAFYMDKYEVTNEEYRRVFPSHTFEPGLERFPVTGISWNEATGYTKKVGKRLPTEQEWERAARGTDARQWPWGNTFDKTRLNSKKDFNVRLQPIGESRLGASPEGCLDMAGNAYEWVNDWYRAYPGNDEIHAEYGQVYRVLRGGSYLTPEFDTRCAARHFDVIDSKRQDYGFRCAMDIVEEPDPAVSGRKP